MKRKTLIWLALALVALVAAALVWATRPLSREWSSGDEAAIEEHEAGRAALEKLYFIEAAEHFRAAVRHDEEFFAARINLAQALGHLGQRDAARAERDRALGQDPARLTARERRMYELAKVRRDGTAEEVRAVLERLAEESGDPEVTRQLAGLSWERGDLEEAVRWSRITIAQAPNDALSYNMLGYIEMGRGNFGEAEANLKRYAYIAPDQANPHDSLGELYTIVGRFDEAKQEFRRALEVNPRFFPALEHLARVAALEGNEQEAVEALRRGLEIAGMAEEERRSFDLIVRGLTALSRGDMVGVREAAAALPAAHPSPDAALLRVLAAKAAGDVAAARAVETDVAARLEKAESGDKATPGRAAAVRVVRAVRLMTEKRWDEAAAEAEAAERSLNYSAEQALLKLTARCFRAEALVHAGRVAEARALVTQTAAVNPRFPGLAGCRALLEGR